jgi:hypothetical protein
MVEDIEHSMRMRKYCRNCHNLLLAGSGTGTVIAGAGGMGS